MSKSVSTKTKYDKWREKASRCTFSSQVRLRLEWIIFYYTHGEENATKTSKHFGISRKTFYKWLTRFMETEDPIELEDQSREPYNKRKWEVTLKQEAKVIELRNKYIHYGKNKLKVLYKK